MITSGAKSVKICLILDPGCVCQTIVITLKNGALAQQSLKQGIYQRAEKVNGKTSWISSNMAIWYDTDEYGTVFVCLFVLFAIIQSTFRFLKDSNTNITY